MRPTLLRLRRAAAWLLVRVAVAVAIPVLVALMLFAFAMALLVEGSSSFTWIDWPPVPRILRRWAHVAWAGWTP